MNAEGCMYLEEQMMLSIIRNQNFPEEIETVAAAYEGVVDCACVPAEDKVCGQVPKLFIEVDSPDFDKKEYIAYLKAGLEASRVPTQVEIIEKIPRTSNGKLQRKRLREK